MAYIVPFFIDPPAKILDCTAGERLIWQDFLSMNWGGIDGQKAYEVVFSDISKDAKADFIADARELHKHCKREEYKAVVFDPPFQVRENEMYSFEGIYGGSPDHKRRDFYFRNFDDLQQFFFDTVESFNYATSNFLIAKIGNRHENLRLIPQVLQAVLAYDKNYNEESEFELFDWIFYRPYRALHGAKLPFSAQVVSFYLIFKKNLRER